MIRFAFLLAVLCALSAIAFARPGLWAGGQIAAVAPSPPTPVQIVFAPTAPQISDTSPANTQVATISVVMSDGSQYAGPTPVFCSASCGNNFGNGGNLFGLTGPINSTMTTAQQLTSANDGTYKSTVKVTQNGTSIFADITVVIVAGGGIPAIAQAAGLTTVALDNTFNQPLYATQSNWLNCANSGGTQIWRGGGPGFALTSPCDINQFFDSSISQNVMRFQWLSSYVGCCFNANVDTNSAGIVNQITIETTANSTNQNDIPTFSVGAFFVENLARFDSSNGAGHYNDLSGELMWTWGHTGSGGIEVDTGEYSLSQNYMNGNFSNHTNGLPTVNSIHWVSAAGDPRSSNLPPGWRATDYHKYQSLLTTDGSAHTYICLFIDGILQQGCVDVLATDPLVRHWFNYSWGPFSNTSSGYQGSMYVQYGRVYSCANWQSAGAAGMCNSSGSLQTGADGSKYYRWPN